MQLYVDISEYHNNIPSVYLGCQIVLTKDLEGLEVELPPATRNFYVDGHVPEGH